MNNFAFLITAYKQKDLTRQNIELIRNKYQCLQNNPIIVVTTSEDISFKELERYPNVYVINFINAPGNPNAYYNNPIQNQDISFRGKWLVPRILYSIKKGIELAISLDCKFLLHLHSDTFWLPEKEQTLIDECDYLKSSNKTMVCDWVGYYPGIHPEGILFNLNEIQKNAFLLNIDEMYNQDYNNISDVDIKENKKYWFNSWSGTEPVILHWFVWTMLKKNFVDLAFPPQEIYNYMTIRLVRLYHGQFNTGLVNLPGEQVD